MRATAFRSGILKGIARHLLINSKKTSVELKIRVVFGNFFFIFAEGFDTLDSMLSRTPQKGTS